MRTIPFLWFFFFLSGIDTLIFHSTFCSASIALVVLPGVKNSRKNKFFLLSYFSFSSSIFWLSSCSNCACTARQDLFSCVSFSSSLSLSFSLLSLSLSLYALTAPSLLTLLALFSTATMCNHDLFVNKKRQV